MTRYKAVLPVWTTLFALVLLANPSVAVCAEKTITPEMVVSFKTVSQVTIDPAGKNVAYVLTVPRSETDEPGGSYSEIWVVSVSGGEPRRYTSKPTSSRAPAWSPDGKYIAFLSKRKEHDKNTQVYQMPIDGGEASLLTHHETSVSAFQWSPDGNSIAYTATDPKSDEETKDEKAGRDWNVVDSEFKHRRLWVVDAASEESRRLYDEDISVWDFEWSPDGKTIVFQASETPRIDDSIMFKKIYTVAPEAGEPVVLCRTEGKLGHMAFSPDGKQIAFLAGVDLNDPSTGSVFVVPAKGGTPKNLTKDFKGTATWLDWTDKRTVSFIAIEATTTTLNQVSAAGAAVKRLRTGRPIFTSASLSKGGKVLAAAASTPEHPSEVFVSKRGVRAKKLQRLTDSNPELRDISFAEQKKFRWNAKDGLEITGLLMKPLDYKEGTRYPLIVQVHGGPEAAYIDGWNTYYSRWTQLLAARGYVVFMPNYRASIGRGVEYAKADHRDLGGKEFDDVLDGIDRLVADGLVDPERVGMGGGSYGGYFSAWAATRHSDRFAAAVDFAGISNWHSMIGVSDIPYELALVHWNLWSYDEPELVWERSPMAHVDNANTPLLIVHGEKDDRVPIAQAWELYTALRVKGRTVEFVIYPREPHGLRERAHRLDFIERVIAWYDRYVKGEPPD